MIKVVDLGDILSERTVRMIYSDDDDEQVEDMKRIISKDDD